MKTVFAEAVLVALVGVAFSFAANALSRRGLVLTHNYTGTARPPAPVQPIVNRSNGTNGPTVDPAAAAALARIHQKGFQVVDDDQILSLYHDPKYQQGLIVFIDARKDDAEYQQGHIPGAYHLNPMAIENVGAVLPACTVAQQIVIYCHGGDCEFSEFAADLLRSVNVPLEKIFIYANGMPGWNNRKLPLESGDRNSGQITGK